MVIFPSLETNITYYCQNKCVSCNHMIPLVEHPYHVDPAIIERDLAVMSKVSHAAEFSIIGGEPTLHPAIMDIIRIVHKSGIANNVLTYTNGQAMRHLPDAFYEELDRLVIDPYKIDDDTRAYITEKCMKAGLPLEWHSTDFTRSFYRNKRSEAASTGLFSTCWFRFNRSVIDEGYFYRCCTSPFIPKYLFGQAKEADGLSLDGITEQKLLDYLNPQQTPEICSVCSGNCGPKIGWSETSRENWLDASLG